MDERELEYLRGQIRNLQRSNTRWKLAAIGALAGFCIFFFVSSGVYFLTAGRQIAVERANAERARDEAMMQAEAARAAEQAARAALDQVEAVRPQKELKNKQN